MIKWGGDGQGFNTPYKHYWIIVSRDEIGWADDDKYGRPPLLVVPLNSYVSEEETPVGPSDILITDKSKIPLLGGKPSIVRCGQLRACRRTKKIDFGRRYVGEELMAEIDRKLIEVLGLEDHVSSLIKDALAKHGVNLS